MKLHEYCQKYFHKGYVKFDYTSIDEGFCTVKQYDGSMFKQFFSLEDGKVKHGSIDNIEPSNAPVVEALELDTQIMVRLPSSTKDEIKRMAKIRGMAASTYIRILIENDILRERQVDKQGYEIL